MNSKKKRRGKFTEILCFEILFVLLSFVFAFGMDGNFLKLFGNSVFENLVKGLSLPFISTVNRQAYLTLGVFDAVLLLFTIGYHFVLSSEKQDGKKYPLLKSLVIIFSIFTFIQSEILAQLPYGKESSWQGIANSFIFTGESLLFALVVLLVVALIVFLFYLALRPSNKEKDRAMVGEDKVFPYNETAIAVAPSILKMNKSEK